MCHGGTTGCSSIAGSERARGEAGRAVAEGEGVVDVVVSVTVDVVAVTEAEAEALEGAEQKSSRLGPGRVR